MNKVIKIKRIISIISFIILASTLALPSAAQSTTYTVRSGDSMWKIAVRYEIGLSELKAANPQIKNLAMIYVGQKITIPEASPLKTLESQVLTLVNRERSSRGLAPLKMNWEVQRCARMKSQDMINKGYFDHQSPTYGSPFKMMESFGIHFSAAGENIAYGQTTAQQVMTAWMNSSGHRANILSPIYTQIGVGAAKKSNGTLYWTQMFIKP
jgi:uncharacterized YkwD family protein/spore coat assembly protein SafA